MAELWVVRQRPGKIVEGYPARQMMQVMDSDIPGHPHQKARQVVEGAAMQRCLGM
jgi:hypothetical protein